MRIWDVGVGLHCLTASPRDILSSHKLSSQTEDKEFDYLEERLHWVSLCVTETKNNVAVYLANLEVRILQLMTGGLGWAPQAGGTQG